MRLTPKFFARFLAAIVTGVAPALFAEPAAPANFQTEVRPLLEKYCFDCHADGANKGKVAFDQFKSEGEVLADHDLWLRVLKNLRAGLMPPQKKTQPTKAEKKLITQWIKRSVFAADPQNPDPGRITLRRLNRVEYHNTIRDLLDVDFDTGTAFPADDTGHGFDNIGDVLTLPPMLLEKYVLAANDLIARTVPQDSKSVPEQIIAGNQFTGGGRERPSSGLSLSYYHPATVTNIFNLTVAGKYQLAVAQMVNEKYVDNVFDYNQCRVIFRVDGKEMHREDYAWEGGKPFNYNYEMDFPAGAHVLSFELQPLTTNEPTRSLSMQIVSVKVSGPLDRKYWVKPAGYEKYFPKPVPAGANERRNYARELLGDFARRAFRRPPEARTLERLVELAASVYTQPGKTFESGVAEGMIAILSSPRFLFLEERAEPLAAGEMYPKIDEFSLASRLSYFLWSSMPDEELLRLAAAGELRKNLSTQVQRLLKDGRSQALIADFTGQWLRARDIETIPIEPRSVLAREQRKIDRADRVEMNFEIRHSMRLETEDTFDYVLRQDRSLLELLDSDYTFLNERLAKHYGLPNIFGDEMRRVQLPADSPRGGVLTQGTVLTVTSNPTRTSPVKRGVFILDSILGTPAPPPPPNIPPLEAAATGVQGRAPTLRETLAAHRENPLCSSCHNRVDPLGLALENFNALGMWRAQEFGQPIDATGKLITGETFRDIRDLKHILVTNHAQDFYHTLTEKMLIYALGRGLDYYDVETTDQIVARINAAGGRASALIAGIVESAPFQRTRRADTAEAVQPVKLRLHADARTLSTP